MCHRDVRHLNCGPSVLNCSCVCASADTCLVRNSVILTDYGDLEFHISHRQVDQSLHLMCVNEETPI